MSVEFPTLRRLSERLDDFLRFRDFRAQRTVGGPLEARTGISRHTRPALVLSAVLCGLLVLASPSWPRAALALVATFAALVIVAWALRLSESREWPIAADVSIQAAMVLTTCAIVWWVGRDTYQPSRLYRHAVIPAAAIVSLVFLVAAGLAGPMFRGLRRMSQYGGYLTVTELFQSRGPAPAVTVGTVLTAILMAFIRAPLALLTPPAIAALLSAPIWVPTVAVVTALLCLFALIIAGVNERFGTMWSFALSALFTGGAAPISVLIIALAALRLAGVTYVTTVFDSVAWRTIGVVLTTSYVLSWWYDYWINRLITDQVIALVDPAAGGRARIAYRVRPDAVRTSVPAAGRVLQIHGASRFLALNDATPLGPFFQSHATSELMELLAISGAPGGKAEPTPLQIRARIANFHAVTTVLLLVLAGAVILRISRGPQLAEATVTSSSAPGVSLAALLDRAPSAGNRPLLVVAASGGGTRAALYTAAVLEGLAGLGRGADIVVASGVSGGGAALAYFAANRPNLTTSPLNRVAWDQYFDTMAQPYIKDVLDRASEWRTAGGGRLGILLGASFTDRWGLPPQRAKLVQITDLGLIFNTSLAGHLQRPDDAPSGPLVVVEPSIRDRTTSTLAGGRLLLTNLELPRGLGQTPLEPDATIPLPVIIRSDDLRLEQAAALNANFPPVFSNAAIDVDDKIRYWVTDGGAVDNRGLEMLLYALRLSLEQRRAQGSPLPPVHVVIADASAYSEDYTQDRGIGSAAGGGAHFASHLNAELAARIADLYTNQSARFALSYLLMPNILRQSGSFGTHWMLQPSIRVRAADSSHVIAGPEMIRVLRALYAGNDSGLTADGREVLEWSRRDPSFAGWQEMLRVFSSEPASAPLR